MPNLKSVTTTVQPTATQGGDVYYIPEGATGSEWPAHIGATAWDSIIGWLYTPTPTDVIYTVEDQPAQIMLHLGSGLFRPLGVLQGDASSIVFVAEWGDDASEGLDPYNPKLTIQDAIDKAATLATEAGPVTVTVLDAEHHFENLDIPSYVNVLMPHGALTGSIVLDDAASFVGNIHTGSVDRDAGSSSAHYRVIVNKGGTVTNTLAGSALLLDVGEVRLEGTTTGISLVTAGATVRGTVGAIWESLAGTTTGIVVSDGTLDLQVSAIAADTAYNVSGGTARISCPSITGTQTHSAGTLTLDMRTDGSRAMTGDLDLGGNAIVNASNLGQTVLSKAQFKNTDTTTNLNSAASVEVPILGTQEYLDSDFSVSAIEPTKRLVCNFDGQIRISGGVGLGTAVATITGTAIAVGVGGVSRGAEAGAGAIVSTNVTPLNIASLSLFYLDVSNGDEISFFATRLNASTATVVQGAAGISRILIERVA